MCLAPQTCIAPISRMQDKAYKMFASRAYLHQYAEFGVDGQHFEDTFARVEEIIARYESL